MNENKSVKVLLNFFWRFAERCGAQIVTFIVSVVLARILTPEDYGQIALILVFTTVMQVFVDSGLGTALIQKKDADDLDFSSVFYFNFGVCLVLYAVMFIASPYIASFYQAPNLVNVIRVTSLTIVISGVKGIQQSYVSRHMLFKRFFFATLGGTIFSAFLGIALAYAGCGIWAIVAQQLSNTAIDTLILWLTVKWRPTRAFSWKRLTHLLAFGWKMLASSLLDTLYNNVHNHRIFHKREWTGMGGDRRFWVMDRWGLVTMKESGWRWPERRICKGFDVPGQMRIRPWRKKFAGG